MLRVLKSGLCEFKDLKDGTLNMSDVWVMNDWLDLNDYIEFNLQKNMESELEK